jgi:arabinofuranosyltransferase
MLALVRNHLGALLGVAAGCLSLAILGDFVTDDAAITLRYSAHLAAGHGVTWNVGEDPVEGYTNFVHVLLGAGAIKLGLPALGTLRLVGQLSLLALTLITYALALPLLRSRMLATAAACLVGIHPAFGYWSSSGLETGLYVALGYAGLLSTRRTALGHGGAYTPAVFFLLAALTRFEGPIMAAAALAPFLFSALRQRSVDPLRPHVWWVAALVLVYGAYFAWRYTYFGHLLSNSAYWKLRADSGGLLIRQFAAQNAVLLVLACGAELKRLGEFGTTVLLLTAAHVVGYYDLRDAVADFHRFFLPIVPGLAVFAASALGRIGGWIPSPRSARVVSVGVFMAAVGADLLNPGAGLAAARNLADRLNGRIEARMQVAAVLLRIAQPSETVSVDDVGVIGYVVQNPVRDQFGLNDESFVHEYGGRRVDYLRDLMAKGPRGVVIASRSRANLWPYYASEAVLAKYLTEKNGYVLERVVPSNEATYSYFVYKRKRGSRTGPHHEQAAAIAADTTRSVSARADAMFVAARRHPR